MGHGKKVATFYFPHIVSINDRICINGQPIADATSPVWLIRSREMEKTLLQTHDQFVLFWIADLDCFSLFLESKR